MEKEHSERKEKKRKRAAWFKKLREERIFTIRVWLL